MNIKDYFGTATEQTERGKSWEMIVRRWEVGSRP